MLEDKLATKTATDDPAIMGVEVVAGAVGRMTIGRREQMTVTTNSAKLLSAPPPPSSSSCTEQSVAGARRRSREWDQRAPAAVAIVNSRRPDAQPTIPLLSVGRIAATVDKWEKKRGLGR